ncbi:hypothetical protein LguiA_002003 [Lonicera macranthoides]
MMFARSSTLVNARFKWSYACNRVQLPLAESSQLTPLGDFNIGQATMQHNDEEDHVCISIGKKLDGLFPSSTGCFIFKVHNQLRKVNEKAYGPDIISTGPYHHGKNNLQMIEEHKLQYLEHRLREKKENFVEVRCRYERTRSQSA